MIVLHGTGEKGKKLVDGENPLPNRAQAKELAQRGYVVHCNLFHNILY